MSRNDKKELDRGELLPSIEVSHVTKTFKVFFDRGGTLKELALFSKRRKHTVRTVLDDISFQVEKGEAIGLIGHNGCGKSTTLKLLTRIMYPDAGTITMRGRVSSLIELGAGFHPDMSGRENIYINASIFGLTKKEIDDRLDEIIGFSELGSYIDNPVRTYSSGMYMRLAFSVAINVDADILLIDEILAVGDSAFQAKCFNRLREIKAGGTTIVLVSHSMIQIERLCDRSIWIHDGKIAMEGRCVDVDLAYLDYMSASGQADPAPAQDTEMKHFGNGTAVLKDVHLVDSAGRDCSMLKTGDSCDIHVSYEIREKLDDAMFYIGIFRSDGLSCCETNTSRARIDRLTLEKDGSFSFHIDHMNLLPAGYRIDVAIEIGEDTPVDYWKEAVRFDVTSKYQDVGIISLGQGWTLE